MNISQTGLALIKQFEGFSPVVYRCPAGIPTIGYGHVVREVSRYAQPIDEARAMQLLMADAAIAADAVMRLISVVLTQPQFDALVSFTFNMGAGKLQASGLRRKVNRGEHASVPAELMRWVYADGKILPGLVKRRAAEGALYATPHTETAA